MTRMAPFSSPLMLGFETMEKTLERVAKGAEGYPPYNIERIGSDDPSSQSHRVNRAERTEKLRITLAVAGFSEDELDVTTEENQLYIRGKQIDNQQRDFLYRGIAARQFQRVFILADGMQIDGAELKNGMLSVDLIRPEPEKMIKKINISVSK